MQRLANHLTLLTSWTASQGWPHQHPLAWPTVSVSEEWWGPWFPRPLYNRAAPSVTNAFSSFTKILDCCCLSHSSCKLRILMCISYSKRRPITPHSWTALNTWTWIYSLLQRSTWTSALKHLRIRHLGLFPTMNKVRGHRFYLREANQGFQIGC